MAFAIGGIAFLVGTVFGFSLCAMLTVSGRDD